MSSSQLKKQNLSELSLVFKDKILLNPYRVEDLKKYAIEGKLSKELLRPMAWKILLGVLPNTTSLREWVEIISNQREEYKKKFKKFCKIKKFIGDPLGGTKKKKKTEEPVEDTDLKNLINKDLDRTHQEMDLFLQNKIKNILANVLYIWSKENSQVSYRQGMNELLAIIFIVFYPFYFTCTRKPKNTKENIIDFLKDINLYKDDIYIFFHDEDEIQSLFDPHILHKDEPGYKLYEIFPQMWKDDSNENNPTYVFRRASLLIKEKLKSLDNDLYAHFKKIDLNCEVFLQRYLRCIFCREFNLEDVYIIWDLVFYDNYMNRKNQKYDFIYMEYICIAMIFKIRDRLKDADQNECFSMLFKYPEIKDIMDIIKLAKKVEQAINERLNGKNSNIYDILGIMKPIESQPSHLFSPPMYNQTSKTNSNNSNNNINTKSEHKYENNSKPSQYSTYDNFEDDEKDNINLDSVNHNYENNNLTSQAKSFFNNALNSLSNFGGIIKDQLQNAKDSVIDSLKGNDSNNNYINNNNNDYDEDNNNNNYQYQQENNNYNNNYKNNSNEYNNEYQNQNQIQNDNEQQSDEIKEEVRKGSFDSQNELSYNKQDINDIVGKLKEIDTKYNMFFNDEDKRNLRIIIDYLKKKI